MRIAIIYENRVDNVIDAGSIESVLSAHPPPPGWEYINGANLNIGDVRNGGGVWRTPTQSSQIPWMITVREFLDRFTTDELDAINIGVRTDTVLARLKDKVLAGDSENPGYINLNSTELSAGLDYAISAGVISANRKSVLLS